jgi:hypothetical protein
MGLEGQLNTQALAADGTVQLGLNVPLEGWSYKHHHRILGRRIPDSEFRGDITLTRLTERD